MALNTRRRFFRWLPAIPLVGPLAVKVGTMAQGVGTKINPSTGQVAYDGIIVKVPSLMPLDHPAVKSIHVLTDSTGAKLPRLALTWGNGGITFPIRINQGGSFVVTVDKGLTLVHSTMGGLVDLVRQSYGLAH